MHVSTSEAADSCFPLLTRLVFLYGSVLKVSEHDLEAVRVQGMQDSKEQQENTIEFILHCYGPQQSQLSFFLVYLMYSSL